MYPIEEKPILIFSKNSRILEKKWRLKMILTEILGRRGMIDENIDGTVMENNHSLERIAA